ncbi:GAP family protein [Streptomyces sp. NPDC048275]|uniref:GAP family protein n=1 Tax=Streptomyces sp. NPDC048275 TaxID=3155629 RepID=UPI0033D648B2
MGARAVRSGDVRSRIAGPGGASTNSQPATWVGALKLALGVLLLVFGARLWRRRPKDASEAQLPKWMATIDRLTPLKVFGLAVALAALNAKNAPLTIAAGASIASAGLSVGEQIASLAIFVLIGSLGLPAPLGVFLMGVLFFVIGLKLLGDGIAVLTS